MNPCKSILLASAIVLSAASLHAKDIGYLTATFEGAKHRKGREKKKAASDRKTRLDYLRTYYPGTNFKDDVLLILDPVLNNHNALPAQISWYRETAKKDYYEIDLRYLGIARPQRVPVHPEIHEGARQANLLLETLYGLAERGNISPKQLRELASEKRFEKLSSQLEQSAKIIEYGQK